MARGNPNPELHPENLSDKTRFKAGEQAREMGRRGGKKRAENEKRRRTLQEAAEMILSERKVVMGQEMSGSDAMMLAIFNKAMKGDVAAAKFIREIVGEEPAQKVEFSGAGGVPLLNSPISIIINEAKQEPNSE